MVAPIGIVQDVRSDSKVILGSLRTPTDTSLIITGVNGTFEAGDRAWLRNCNFRIESPDSSIRICEDVAFSGSIFLKGASPNNVVIGSGTTCGQANIICGEGTTVSIGQDCMLAWGIEIRTTDSHGIFDIESGVRINPPRDIIIGDNVWLAAKTTLLKGTQVSDGSVVGMGSFTSSVFSEKNVMIAGNPAKILRRGVRWERPLLG